MKYQTKKQTELGFSLIELLVAMGIFAVIGTAAISLVRQHQPLFSKQQNQAAVNAGMRTALGQMQIDLANAGSDFTGNPVVPLPAFGVTIEAPPVGATCFDPTAKTYGPGCFDTIHIVTLDLNTPPSQTADKSGTTAVSKSSSTIFATPVPGSGITAAQLAGDFSAGQQILLIQVDQSNNITGVAATDLSCSGNPASVNSGVDIKLQHNPSGSSCATSTDLGLSLIGNSKLGQTFTNGSFIVGLGPTITYGVDATNPADPQLYRQVGTGPKVVIADQIIGFKVGSALSGPPTLLNTATTPPTIVDSCDAAQYYFLSPGNLPCPQHNPAILLDFTQIRSLKISLISRTVTNVNDFPNTFDGGRYRVEANSVVVYPRNLAINQ